jgi:hypothetical protein
VQRLLWLNVCGDASLGLGLILGFLAILVGQQNRLLDQQAQRQQKQEELRRKELEKHLQRLSNSAVDDPLAFLKELRQLRERDWDLDDAQTFIQQFLSSAGLYKDDKFKSKLLSQIATDGDFGPRPRFDFMQQLHKAVIFYNDRDKALAEICENLKKDTLTEADAEKVIEICSSSFDDPNDDDRQSFVARVFLALCEAGYESLAESKLPDFTGLIGHPWLQKIRPPAPKYQLSTDATRLVHESLPDREATGHRRWAEQLQLQWSPFEITRDDFADAESAFNLPIAADHITAKRPAVLISDCLLDRVIAASLAVSPNTVRDGFLVTLRLPRPDFLPEATPVLEALRVLARAMAERWIEFLTVNPRAFFYLDKPRRYQLEDLLVWAKGASLYSTCDAGELGRSRYGRDLLKAMSRFSKALPRSPDPSDLMNWLSLRPVGTTYSAIAIVVAEDTDLSFDQARAYLRLAQHLDQVNVALKLFGGTPLASSVGSLPQSQLSWASDAIWNTLTLRVRSAALSTDRARDFGALLEEGVDPQSLAESLTHRAGGSLTGVLRLCSAAVERRLTRVDSGSSRAYTLSDDDFAEEI